MPADRAVELEAMSVENLCEAYRWYRTSQRDYRVVLAELQRRIDAARDEGRREGLKIEPKVLDALVRHRARETNPPDGFFRELGDLWILADAYDKLAAPTPVEESP